MRRGPTAAVAVVLAVACTLPLALTVWALLDAARRPEWAWALAGRRRVVWLAAILFGGDGARGGHGACRAC